jgi:IS30 family transposase
VDYLVLTSPKSPPTKSFLHQKYVLDGLSSAEIGSLIFSSRSTVTKYLKRHGVPLKNINNRQRGRACFGFRQHRGRAVAVANQQSVIEAIKSLREKGKSYQKIANFLNDEGARTKSGKAIWHSKVVRQVWLRERDLCIV